VYDFVLELRAMLIEHPCMGLVVLPYIPTAIVIARCIIPWFGLPFGASPSRAFLEYILLYAQYLDSVIRLCVGAAARGYRSSYLIIYK